jgi:23S rRNA (cytidine2498-2'-O)-methyltransferase
MNSTGYLAPSGFEDLLRAELQGEIEQFGRLFIAPGAPQKVHWAQNIWYDPVRITFLSITDAANQLRKMQKLWSFYPYLCVRRGMLISSKLPYFSPKPIPFLAKVPKNALGSWTLIDANTMIAASHCSSPFANGEIHFQESSIPPGRAYLKLWEFFTRTDRMPQPNDKCIDLGASPGSWTWVLQSLGAHVIAVDRAPLASALAQLPNVTFWKKDAFSLQSDQLSDVKWVFCDVVCYPEKLLGWLQKCLPDSPHINFVCTIKFQGEGDHSIVKEFERIAESSCLHLFHNKHELTWFRFSH